MVLSEITGLAELSWKYGVSTVGFFFILVVYVVWQGKRDKVLLKEIQSLRELLLQILGGRSVIGKDQTTWVFRAVLNIHIRRKILFAKQKLINNHINTRRSQIEAALSSEFRKITQEEAQFLSSFVTPAGDMGTILADVLEQNSWDAFMEEIYTIFFGTSTLDQKLEDLASFMESVVNDMILKIESKM